MNLEADASGNDRQMYEQLAVVSSAGTPTAEAEAVLAVTEFEDVLREGISRADTNGNRLVMVAGRSQDANTLGRVVGHPLCPIETIKSIRAIAESQRASGETWMFLVEYAERVIRRRETGKFSFQEDA